MNKKPVIIGISGIVSLILFFVLMPPGLPTFEVSGLKPAYFQDEEISFTVTAKNFRDTCIFPSYDIFDIKESSPLITKSYMTPCEQNYFSIISEKTWKIPLQGESLSVDKEGDYTLVVQVGNDKIFSDFQVAPVSKKYRESHPEFEWYWPDLEQKTGEIIYKNESEHFTNITIAGLKDSYKLGEPLEFAIQISGYGPYCVGHQSVIERIDGLAEPTYVPDEGRCPPPPWVVRPFEFRWNYPGQYDLKPITKPGTYVLKIESGDANMTKQFSVLESDYIFDYYVIFTTKKGPYGASEKTKVDLRTGDVTIIGKNSTSVLDSETLSYLNKLMIDHKMISNGRYHYADDKCVNCMHYMLEAFEGNYSVYIIWTDQENEWYENHQIFTSEILKIFEKINNNLNNS